MAIDMMIPEVTMLAHGQKPVCVRPDKMHIVLVL